MTIDWNYKTAAFLDAVAMALSNEKESNFRQRMLNAAGITSDDDLLAGLSNLRRKTAGFDRPPWLDDNDIPACATDLQVTHPLSGNIHTLKLTNAPATLQSALASEVKKISGTISWDSGLLMALVGFVEKIIRQLVQGAGDDPRKKFLRLWRLLPEQLCRQYPGVPWNLLPADPRIPSHTIWDHATVMSAFAGAGKQPAILLFTIASAQEFVAAARRTQDSWMGSFLLSWLSWSAIKAVVEKCGPDAILSPSLRDQPLVDWWLNQDMNIKENTPPDYKTRLVASMPNIFAAVVPSARVTELAGQAETNIHSAWQHIGTQVREKLEITVPSLSGNESWTTIWTRQIKRFPDRLGIFWSASTWPEKDVPLEIIERSSGQISEEDEQDWLKLLQELIKNLPKKQQRNGLVYHLLSATAGRALTGRKGLRDFIQNEEPGFKCSLCGLRQALADEEKAGYRNLNAFWSKLAGSNARSSDQGKESGLKLQGRIRRGDKLCSVCLTKRLALEAFFEGDYLKDHHLFPSTASLAVAPFIIQCLQHENTRMALSRFSEKAAALLKAHEIFYPASLPAAANKEIEKWWAAGTELKDVHRLDGAWYYQDSWDIDSIKRECNHDTLTLMENDLKECRDALHHLLNEAKATDDICTPSRYYTMVAMDGDKMSEWLMGKQKQRVNKDKLTIDKLLHEKAEHSKKACTPDFIRPMGPAMQLALSSCLGNFALKLAQPAVEAHGGVLIYAGGDDLLALLPAAAINNGHGLLPALKEVRNKFVGGSTGFLEENGETLRLLGGDKGMTISMGVAIVHHSWPLSKAVAWVQELLKHEAKEKWDRNSFSLGFLSRSGGERRAGGKFETNKEGRSLLDSLKAISNLMDANALSPRIGYRLGGCRWARSCTPSAWTTTKLTEALEHELLRLCRQHIKKQDKANEIIKEMRCFYNLVTAHISAINDAGKPAPNLWENLTNLLIIAAFSSGREV